MIYLSNQDVAQLLTPKNCIEALEGAFIELAKGRAISRPRTDVFTPCDRPDGYYRWGTMEGANDGYFAIRMKSDVVYETNYNGVHTQEKYCSRPGLFCGLVLLTSIETGEPLAFINDGVLQHMRVGGDGGKIGRAHV